MIRARRARILGAVWAAGALAWAPGCISGTSLDDRPTQARVRVDGTAPGPLQLVVSTDFHEERTSSGAVIQVMDAADTTRITLPWDRTLALTELGGIIVELTNQGAEPADLELRVQLDQGHQEDVQDGTVPPGGSLRYFFLFYLGP